LMAILSRTLKISLIVLIAFSFIGCAAPEKRGRTKQADMQSMLSEAGFTRTNADSVQELDAIRALPQEIVFPQFENGKNYYSYADAQGCQCVYVGTETDFFQFEQIVIRRGAQRNQCIDERLSANQDEQWKTFGGLSALCGR
jgi:hypothetical protein